MSKDGRNPLTTLWDNLTKLSMEDPDKYRKLMEGSAEEHRKLQTLPLPHTCIKVDSLVSE